MIELTLLEKLSNAVATAGAEGEVRKLIREQIKDHVAEITVDALGNLIARKPGTGASPLKVMLTAHMDEPGFMVSAVSDDGLISVNPIGKPDLRYLPAARVVVGHKKTPGVFLWVPIHRSHERQTLVDVKDMQIDTGASSKSAASVGDRVGVLGMFSALNERIVRGKAFDSRAACAVLIALLQAGPPSGPLPFDLYAVFSTMRTQAGRGALVAAHRLAPDAVISLGGSECDDLPRTPDDIDKQAVIRLGGGPVLALTDRLAVMDRPLFAHLTRTAHVAGLPFQMDANVTVTEAGRIAITQPGAVTASLGIPVRYLGSPSALLDLADLDTAERLLWQALLTLTPDLLRP